jgi:AcrR family transcriptional regulator
MPGNFPLCGPSSMPLAPSPDRSDAAIRFEMPEPSTPREIEVGSDQFAERSRQIVGAAYELLGEGGLEGLTIRAVLKKTGLARRAFYERFAGKDELMLAVFEETIRSAAGLCSEQMGTLADPIERLKLIVTSIVLGKGASGGAMDEQSTRRGAALSREHLRLADTRPRDLAAALSPLIELMTRQLSDGMAAKSVRNVDPRRLATLVYNLVSATVQTELLSEEAAWPDDGQRARLAADIWEFCRRAIVA